jgi:hypothetical protein
MERIWNAYSDSLPDKYVVRYGNSYIGWRIKTKKELIANWKRLVQRSFYSAGDISLLYNGQTIRVVWNAHVPILQKVQFPYGVGKYPYNENLK